MTKNTISKDFDPNITFPAYLVRKRLLNGIRSHANKFHGKMMDFGCGSKPYRLLFSNINEYVGVDYHGQGHSHENEQIDVFYDGQALPFENSQFDCVLSSEVFEHVFNIDEILPEIRRVMKNNGLILITCPFAICEHEVPNDFARYSTYALQHIFKKHGFEIIEQERLGNSVEVVVQLWIMYIHIHIARVLQHIPVIRSLFKFFTYTSLNLFALAFGKIFPQGKELYLNNLVLARKKD